MSGQHLCKALCPACGTAKEDHNIPISNWSVFPCLLIQDLFFSHNFPDPVRNGQCFHFLCILPCHSVLQFFPVRLHQQYFCGKELLSGSLFESCPRIKSRSIVIFYFAQILSHDLPENEIGTFQHLGTASEILMKVNPLFLAVR